ncbi:MAG: peptide ABC transporter substrate-binding protein [Clostridiales bacterium]|nr:peptide ABC transporter substrate-binding protein [Clostridiales bacterium]
MKRLISLILLAAMVLSLTPAMAQENAYRVLYSGEVSSLNYLTTATTNEFAVAANVIDTLVEYDNLGQVKPSLAESWEVSEDGLTWTFKIRQGAKWVDGNAQVVADVTANDFVDAAKYVLDAANASATANILYSVIEGAEAYFAGTSTPKEGETPAPKTEWETVGVKAVDDYTLQYSLIYPVPYFLSMTTYVCFMPVYGPFLAEKGADFGLATGNDTLLYNGAYYISEMKPQESRVYTKNPTNWDAEHVYIEQIKMSYNKEAATVSSDMYRRGEVDSASIDNQIAREWLQNPDTADLIRPVRQTGFYTHFYAYNFKPEFDAVYEPENWKLAVNNENFRKAVFYGFDRVKLTLVGEPDNPESIMHYTITPPNFVDYNGLDYVKMGDLAPWTELGKGAFDEAKAKEFAAKAKEELTAAGATLPVKVLTVYHPSYTTWADQTQVLEQQLEALLGEDFIDLIVEAGPSQNFLSEVRRSGKYALLDCNWGPDYADPETFTDPFKRGGNYNFPEYTTEVDENGKNKYDVYEAMVAEAKAITGDIEARYLAFAKAEAYLIENAFVLPVGYTYAGGGYTASRLDPFEGQYAPFGISIDRYKGQHLLDKPMNTDQYFDAQDKWEADRAALSK